jgi:hypothetical protein
MPDIPPLPRDASVPDVLRALANLLHGVPCSVTLTISVKADGVEEFAAPPELARWLATVAGGVDWRTRFDDPDVAVMRTHSGIAGAPVTVELPMWQSSVPEPAPGTAEWWRQQDARADQRAGEAA